MIPAPDDSAVTAVTSMDLVIFGAGGFAREVAWLAESAVPPTRVVCFVDEQADGVQRIVHGIPVHTPDEASARHSGAAYVCAVGAPAARRAFTERIEGSGFVPATLVHPSVHHSRSVAIGEGTIICAGTTLTTDIVLGRHVQINLHCTIGHDAVIGDFCTLAPGVHVSGNVQLRPGVYVGSGAVFINGRHDAPLVIEEGAVIGAGACVIRDVPAGTTVVGVPARARG